MNETFALGLRLMGYGLVGVFTTLIIFMILIYALTKFLPPKEDSDGLPK